MPRKKAAKEKAKAVVEESQQRDDPEVARLKKHVANLETQLEQSGNPETDQRVLKLQGQVSSLKGKLKSALNLVDLERERNDVILKLGDATPTKWTIGKRKHIGGHATVCGWFSDWHVEARILAEKTDGYNEFNLNIARTRIHFVTESFLKCLEYARGETTVDHILLGWLGDFISGYIHEELQETNELSPLDATFWVQEELMGMLEVIHREAKLPITIMTNIGNHGRTTKKPRIGTAAENSFEFHMYRQIERYYRNDPRFTFKITRATDNVIDVGGFVIRTCHGDEYRYGGGVGGLAVPLRRGIKDKNDSVKSDLDVLGHFHNYQEGDDRYLVNGCLCGFDPYAKWIRAVRKPPVQAMSLIHSVNGHVYSRKLYCGPQEQYKEVAYPRKVQG